MRVLNIFVVGTIALLVVLLHLVHTKSSILVFKLDITCPNVIKYYQINATGEKIVPLFSDEPN